MKLKTSPLQLTVSFLSIYSAIALSYNFSINTLLHLAATLGFGLILFGLFTLISKKKKSILNTIISTLIIFLVLHYGNEGGEIKDLLIPLTVTFIAIFSKFFLEYKGSPIINPVVLALLTTYYISTPLISWWGTNFAGYISLTLIALWIALGIKKWRKSTILIAFLLAHITLLLIRQQSLSTIQFILTDATIYFMAGIMLIDPKTSPILKKEQIIYGIIAALSYNLLAHYQINNFNLLAIAAANLYFFSTKILKLRKSTRV